MKKKFFLTSFLILCLGIHLLGGTEPAFTKRGATKYARTSGHIEALNGNKIIVKTPKGKLKEFTLTTQSMVMRKGAKVNADQLIPGMTVKLLRFQKSDHQILRIELGP